MPITTWKVLIIASLSNFTQILPDCDLHKKEVVVIYLSWFNQIHAKHNVLVLEIKPAAHPHKIQLSKEKITFLCFHLNEGECNDSASRENVLQRVEAKTSVGEQRSKQTAREQVRAKNVCF